MNIFNILALSVLQGYLLVKIKAIWYIHNYRRTRRTARKVQTLSRNITLNSGSISQKFTSISNLSIRLQILILNTAYYLQIKVGLIMIHHMYSIRKISPPSSFHEKKTKFETRTSPELGRRSETRSSTMLDDQKSTNPISPGED
jgi:hypothetical protein